MGAKWKKRREGKKQMKEREGKWKKGREGEVREMEEEKGKKVEEEEGSKGKERGRREGEGKKVEEREWSGVEGKNKGNCLEVTMCVFLDFWSLTSNLPNCGVGEWGIIYWGKIVEKLSRSVKFQESSLTNQNPKAFLIPPLPSYLEILVIGKPILVSSSGCMLKAHGMESHD